MGYIKVDKNVEKVYIYNANKKNIDKLKRRK